MRRLLNNRVFKNASWIVVCRIVQMILNLFVGMLTARYLGPSNYGLINYASSITAFAIPIMQLGLSNILVREIVDSSDQDGEVLGTSVIMSFVSAILCIIGVSAFAICANGNEQETVLVCIVYSFTLVFQAFELIQYWFQAKLLSKYTSIIMLMAYIVMAAYKIALLITGKNVYWFAASHIVEEAVIGICLITIYKRVGKEKLTFSLKRGKSLFKKSKYYIVSSLMVTIFAQTDKIMLKLMVDSSATGFYAAATTCAALTAFVFSAIIDSMRPTIFEAKKVSTYKFEERLKLLYSIIIYLSLAQSLAMTILAKLIIFILYGSSYYASVSALRIVVWYTTFAYIGSVRNIWILAEEKQKYLWIINLSGALLNIVLNYILIPFMGINGAALASLFTQIFTNIIIGYIIKPIKDNKRILVQSINLRGIINLIKNT